MIQIEVHQYPEVRPKKVGRYLVHRAGCDKTHFAKWNGGCWAYDDNTITSWCEIPNLKSPPVNESGKSDQVSISAEC